ncbi:MAG: T9SS type A sorting domain-containing protein [candidate division KSB1 bacterium]|nr:T9SS type A sorting domain-containing protein [candidate division KSB1 bacterium]MDZ7304358.1 T9SS type A sorting domain-containing protein [candidate division KSB1 bacterium]MDZ7313671.1 T9SS type A sorting domain-containing protein [candidate division KSB1 bacterium]
MRRFFLCLAVFMMVVSGASYSQTIINYGNLTFPSGFSATNFSEVWDLTQGDLILTYTIDMTGVTQPAPWQTSYTEVGIREMGASNFNPGPWNTYQGGKGGWMTSLVGNLAPSPGTQSLHDKHNLSASGGRDELDYDATNPNTIIGPSGTYVNYGIWFDRDGVDPWQATYWGAVNGGTYNTGGIYHIVISYHAISPTLGTMFATINGIPTGFYTAGWFNGQPPFYPAGLSFKGDMTKMQVFSGLWAPSPAFGTVTVSNITVSGYLSYIYNYVFLANNGVEIERSKYSKSKGTIRSNDDVYFMRGDPTTFTGNLIAVDDVKIDKENTIAGNVTAGEKICLDPGSTITGTATPHATVATLPMPTLSYSAGGASYTLKKNEVRTLAPGSYGNVIVGNNATLKLSTGNYFFKVLETKTESILEIDVTSGPVTINVVTKLLLGKEITVTVKPSGEAGSDKVIFNTLQSTKVTLDKGGYILGTVIAPNTEVLLAKNNRFRGAICAQKIIVERDVVFMHHTSPGTLSKSEVADDDATDPETTTSVVTDYELAQNYPNPFNPTTTIRFALPEAGEVTLTIYNSMGQRVRTLVSGQMNSGWHSVVWDAKDDHGVRVASGVYLYVIKAGSFTAQRKLVLMK